jgi:hypothetical protein
MKAEVEKRYAKAITCWWTLKTVNLLLTRWCRQNSSNRKSQLPLSE